MSEKTEKKSEAPAVGRKWKGEPFPAVKTVEQVQEENALRAQYADDNAMSIEAYFVHKRIRNPVMQAAMAAYTKVRKATVAAFDEIFSTF